MMHLLGVALILMGLAYGYDVLTNNENADEDFKEATGCSPGCFLCLLAVLVILALIVGALWFMAVLAGVHF